MNNKKFTISLSLILSNNKYKSIIYKQQYKDDYLFKTMETIFLEEQKRINQYNKQLAINTVNKFTGI